MKHKNNMLIGERMAEKTSAPSIWVRFPGARRLLGSIGALVYLTSIAAPSFATTVEVDASTTYQVINGATHGSCEMQRRPNSEY